MVTNLCRFSFDKTRARFRLETLHPGVTLEEVRDNTGFDFDMAEKVIETPAPNVEQLSILRGELAATIADPYPRFAQAVWGVGEKAS